MQKIILYYKFTPVKNPEALRKWQTVLCAEAGLNGRIIVSDHGINGTLGGDKEALEYYIEQMESVQELNGKDWSEPFPGRFSADLSGIEYKWSNGGYSDFPRLSVKCRKELVTLDPDTKFNPMNKSVGLRPKEWHEYIKNNPDVPILDARNDYESDVGKFKGAITPKISAFKELKPELDKLDKNKPLLTYCTGDIRCEYLSAYMQEKGFNEVYHLDGGIVKYGEEFGDDGFWEGKCYVFDDRTTVAFSEDAKDLADCAFCSGKTSSFRNCGNSSCNKRQIVCDSCQVENPLCSACKKAPVNTSS